MNLTVRSIECVNISVCLVEYYAMLCGGINHSLLLWILYCAENDWKWQLYPRWPSNSDRSSSLDRNHIPRSPNHAPNPRLNPDPVLHPLSLATSVRPAAGMEAVPPSATPFPIQTAPRRLRPRLALGPIEAVARCESDASSRPRRLVCYGQHVRRHP
jgi:hypothetical protein